MRATEQPDPVEPGSSVRSPAVTPFDVRSAVTHAGLSSVAVAGQPLEVVLRLVAEMAVQIIPGADDASVTVIEGGRPTTVASFGRLAATLDERQYEAGFGPCIEAAHGGQTIDLDTEDESGPYPDFARQARRQGVRHVLALGMPTQQATSGALNLYSSAGFDRTARAAARSFAGYAAVTLFNATVYAEALEEVAQLKEALVSRAGIEQAKGIIMVQKRCTADEAFAILSKTSSATNQKLRDVAREVVERACSA